MGKLLSIAEASEYLLKEHGVSLKPGSLRKKIQKKEIPYYDLGRPKLKISDLEKFIETKRRKAETWPQKGI